MNRKVAINVIKDLIACDLTKREAKILVNTVDQQNFMLKYRSEEIERLNKEIESRKNLLKVKDEMIELGYKKQDELNQQIRKEKRKKTANKFIYFIGGFGLGYVVFKM